MADYTLIFDGGCRRNGLVNAEAYGSYCLRTRTGKQKIVRLTFEKLNTNNQAEYSALLAGLKDLKAIIKRAGKEARLFSLKIQGDSALVFNQVQAGEKFRGWKCNSARLRLLRDEARELLACFKEVEFWQVPREEIVKILGH